jgi:hypothetical protein
MLGGEGVWQFVEHDEEVGEDALGFLRPQVAESSVVRAPR